MRLNVRPLRSAAGPRVCRSSGETDPDRLRTIGIHNFESYVRFELAPRLAASRCDEIGLAERIPIFISGSLGWVYDQFLTP